MAPDPEDSVRIDPALEELARKLFVLANPNRLQLLELLRFPRAIGEIRLPAQGPGAVKGAVMARQSVREHLDRLEELELVRRAPGRRDHARVDEYHLDVSRLYALAEEFRALATAPAPRDRVSTATLAAPAEPAPERLRGPRLVVVHGREEGRAFPLRPGLRATGRGWVIGRRQGLAVCLDYDPFVSGEHAEVLEDADGFRVADIRSSMNGTFVNWERLRRGGDAPLENGDVVGIGRTLLLFRDG